MVTTCTSLHFKVLLDCLISISLMHPYLKRQGIKFLFQFQVSTSSFLNIKCVLIHHFLTKISFKNSVNNVQF